MKFNKLSMKYLILFLAIGLCLASCKKTEYHKVTYKVNFLDGTNSPGASNFIEIYATPNYSDQKPTIDRFNIPQSWQYEYLGLEKGQEIQFIVHGQLNYHFEMILYIDGVQVSYRRVIVSSNTYYADHVEESYGLNDKENEDTGIIQFIYQ